MYVGKSIDNVNNHQIIIVMASLKFKFRPPKIADSPGSLFMQIAEGGQSMRLPLPFKLYAEEWDVKSQQPIMPNQKSDRLPALAYLKDEIDWLKYRFNELDTEGVSIRQVVDNFTGQTQSGTGVFDYLRSYSRRMERLGRKRCGEMIMAALRSLLRFRRSVDLGWEALTPDLMEEYEAYLKGKNLTRNSTSFYMRNLRAAYNKAVNDGRCPDLHPFKKVYTGVDKTIKRALNEAELKAVRSLNLSSMSSLAFARDMAMASFFLRGMAFVDMAFLRKKDLSKGFVTYHRRKTGQYLTVEVLPQLQSILEAYPSKTQYLLPIINKEDGTERHQYQSKLSCINRSLKKVGEMAHLSLPLTTYVMRHTWATIARTKNIPISVISAALGHDNEKTTHIYLDSIQSHAVDEANRLISQGL